MKPPNAPIAIAITLSRVERWSGPSSLCDLMNVRARNPAPPRIRAPPTTFWKLDMLLSPTLFAISTPISESGDRADEHPVREAGVDRAEHPVARRAERLEDRAVEDVGADRDLRVEPEEQDQDRRHQAAAAHSGHPDEEADAEPRQDELPGHAGRGGSGQETNGLPVSRQRELVRLAAGAEAGDRGEERQGRDEQRRERPRACRGRRGRRARRP